MLRKQICLVTILMAFLWLSSSGWAGYVDIPVTLDNTTDQENAMPLSVASVTPINYQYSWTRNLLSGWSNEGLGIAFDATSNNIVIAGYFTQTINFAPNGGTDNHTSTAFRDAYVWKMDTNHTYNSGGWSVTRRGGNVNDNYSDICIDNAGNIYVAGGFDTGSYPNGWGPTQTVAKYSPTGTLLWSYEFGSLGNYAAANSLALGDDGSIYVVGWFQGTVTLINGATPITLTSRGGSDAFLYQLHRDGTLSWVKTFGGAGNDYLNSVAVSGSSVYTAGSFENAVSFPDQTLAAVNGTDGIVVLYDNNGAYQWSQTLVSPNGSSYVNSVKTIENGQIVVGGTFQGGLSNGIGTAVPTVSAVGGYDAFVAALNANGSVAWLKSYGGTADDWLRKIKIGLNGKIYAVGSIHGQVDLDPGTGSQLITTAGSQDGYVLILDNTGNYAGHQLIGSPGGTVFVDDVAFDSAGGMYLTGSFDGTIDFDTGSGTYIVSDPAVDSSMFVSKYTLVPTVPPVVPGVPIIGTATAGNAQATVTFTPPASSGGSAITSYTATSNPGGKTATGSGSPIVVTGLNNGTAYTFTVKATNSAGTGAPSASSNSVTPFSDDGNTCATATDITLNSSRSGSIETAGDYDYFRVVVPSSGTITVYTTGVTDTYGYLKNSNCDDIENDDDDGEGYNFNITRSVTAGTYYVAVQGYSTRTGPYTLNVQFVAPPLLSVTPSNQNVSKDAGTTTFSVSNTGAGTMLWSAAVTPASSWLRITSGATGTNSGTINCGFDANTSTSARTATIRVTSTGATGSPVDVTVTQAPKPVTAPGAPTIGTATAGNAQATVNFTPPYDGGSPIISYTVTSNPGGKTATGSASPITITGLTNGTAYTFTVTATNVAGTSLPSSASSSVTPITVPGAPTIGIATAGNAQVTVNFTPPASNGGSLITSYTATSNPGGKTANGSGSQIVVTGLTNGTAYTFVVTATNAAGSSPASSPSNSVTPCTVPGAPTIGTATAGNTLATVNFTPPVSNGGSPITSYTVTSNPGAKAVTGSASPIVVPGLTNGTAYTFVVTATNAAGTSPPSSSSNSVTPCTVPGAPTIGTATAGNAQATVNFTPPASNGGSPITSYTVTSNPGGKTASGSSSPIVVPGLTNGTTYTFTVIATNAAGSSPPSASSNSVTLCTVPGAPTIGTATAGNAQATVYFTPPTSNGGCPITGYTVTSNTGGKTANGSSSPITITGLTNDTPYTFTVTATNAAGISPPSSASNSVTPSAKTPIIGSNSIDEMDVVKITDMSGLLPDGGRTVAVSAWDKDGKQLTASGYALPVSIYNHGTTSIQGRDLVDRFPDGAPAVYSFLVESSKMFITNVNNSVDGAVKVPIIYSNGLSNFVSNSIGARNTLKLTDMSGTIESGGIAISLTAWDASGKAIPESTSAAPLKLYSHGTTTIAGSSLPARFPLGTPITYEFTVASPKLVISNVKNSSDGTLNIPTVYTVGVSSFVSNSIGARNTIYISDFSGALDIGGAAISVRAWDVSGTEIPESVSVNSYKIFNYETVKITGAELGSRFSSGAPITYEFTVDSSKVVITNVKSSSDGSINIPTVYTSGITNYTTNYVSDLNTIRITDMSGGIPAGGASITVTARDVGGILIPESGSATALKLNNHGTTTIEGNDLRNRFLGGTPVTYEFSIGSSSAVVTNLTESTDGTINIPTVFTFGPCGGI